MSTTVRGRPQKPIVDEILDVLSNVLFPVGVFCVWAAATTIGTIIDQNQTADHYYAEYPAPVANLIVRLHLDGVFHSVPYIALVVLLLISMTVCTFRRVIPKRFPPDRAVPIDHFALHASFSTSQPREDAARASDSYLRKRGFVIRTQEIDGAHWTFAHSRKWARYGVLIAHLGFVVLCLGVFLGWRYGYRGAIQVFEGQTLAIEHTPVQLTLDKFTAEFEPVRTPTGVLYQASKFESDVTVAGPNDHAAPKIIVNHPYVTSGGVYIYQASYGFAGRMAVTHNGRAVALDGTQRLMPQDELLFPGTSRGFQYMTMAGPSDPSQVPPGAPLPAHDEYIFWAFHDNIPTTDKPIFLPVGKSVDVGDGYRLTALSPIAWSGLTYRSDPGESFVGAGVAILIAGFVISLFFLPVKLYARIRDGVPGTLADVAVTTTKGNAMYEDEFADLVAGWRSVLSADAPTLTAHAQPGVKAVNANV
ncbi:MAG TPA: cytochrome c biogenesis protein ResB [Candidatus Eremiobacteraceae bacterium]|nr:cytochrome c biogenesis protein ResB [Candidatus Eremiobacteraceae bacterium]